MLKILLVFFSFCACAWSRGYVPIPPPGFQSNFWQQVQTQDALRMQQLQSQDQYRRMLLLQDQQWQMDRMGDQQRQLESMQQNLNMHQYSDRLRLYSRPTPNSANPVKEKPVKGKSRTGRK